MLVVPLIAHVGAGLADTFDLVDYFVWALFVVEYLTKLYLSPSRRGFVAHNLWDLVVIAVPFLRPLRAVRLLRLVRLTRIGVLLANGLRRVRAILVHRGLHFVLLGVAIVVFVMAAVELGFEDHAHGANIHNYGQALWWAIVTVTTVGYGDKYPVSAGGRGAAVVLMVVGIGLIGVLTATVASYFVEEEANRDKDELAARLDRIEAMLARALAHAGPHEAETGGLDGSNSASSQDRAERSNLGGQSNL